ncbi:MAG: hypothetical protein MJ232_02055 [archaeon]|nr:hypothetical protein [archaeon]
MKGFMLTLRFIITLAAACFNLNINIIACKYILSNVNVWFSQVPAVLVAVVVFVYFLFQIALVPYIMYKSMSSGCRKYGIKYC